MDGRNWNFELCIFVSYKRLISRTLLISMHFDTSVRYGTVNLLKIQVNFLKADYIWQYTPLKEVCIQENVHRRVYRSIWKRGAWFIMHLLVFFQHELHTEWKQQNEQTRKVIYNEHLKFFAPNFVFSKPVWRMLREKMAHFFRL